MAGMAGIMTTDIMGMAMARIGTIGGPMLTYSEGMAGTGTDTDSIIILRTVDLPAAAPRDSMGMGASMAEAQEASMAEAVSGAVMPVVAAAAAMADDGNFSNSMNSKTYRFASAAIFAFGLFYLTTPLQAGAQNKPVLSQRTFSSVTEATNALITAAREHNRQAMHEIFGPEITNLLTGDQALDDKHFDRFTAGLTERCDVVPEGSQSNILQIGKEEWSFPIPLVQTNGSWMFDTRAGEEEIINRHIGRDEYYAIGVCRAYVKAQREYAAGVGGGKYAACLKSAPGQKNGLYWPDTGGGPPSPLASFVAEACTEGYDGSHGKGPRPFHGYLFKILTCQGHAAPGGKMDYRHQGGLTGGFGLVAYPIRWGDSGIMTFMVNQDGVVYQRMLGPRSSRIALAMKEYNPSPKWTMVQEMGMTDLTQNAPAEIKH